MDALSVFPQPSFLPFLSAPYKRHCIIIALLASFFLMLGRTRTSLSTSDKAVGLADPGPVAAGGTVTEEVCVVLPSDIEDD